MFINLALIHALTTIRLDVGEELTMYQEIKEDGFEFKFKLTPITPTEGLFFNITKGTDLDSSNFDSLKPETEYSFKTKGIYTISLYNSDRHPCVYSIQSSVDQPYTSDETHMKLRQSINKLESELASMYEANMQLLAMKKEHIAEARKIYRRLFLTLVFAFVYLGVGFVKTRKLKSLFESKK